MDHRIPQDGGSESTAGLAEPVSRIGEPISPGSGPGCEEQLGAATGPRRAKGVRKLSVVVPTWNEALWLPRLLDGLRGIPEVGEIVVADNNSTDGTLAAAQRYGCNIAAGGRPGTARNRGTEAASGGIIAFIDADAVVSREAIQSALRHFASPATVAVCFRLLPITSRRLVTLSYWLMNLYFRILCAMGFGAGTGSFIAVRRSALCRVGGFNEKILAASDVDLLRRLSRVGRVQYDPRVRILVSARRFDLESRAFYMAKCVMWALLRLVGTDRSVVAYKWSAYSPAIAERENTILHARFSD
jgi:glycosyltransferase involved in cell wall biosynthesis